MANKVGSILRAATRREDEPLNILCCPTHERYESGLALTGHNFYSYRTNGVKDWNEIYAKLPANYILLPKSEKGGIETIPGHVDFDLMLTQTKFGQFQLMDKFSKFFGVPMISLEHTLPMPAWGPNELSQLHSMRGDINVFISEYSREKWGWQAGEAHVVHHGINTDLFTPGNRERKPYILSVVNEWITRDVFCGFKLWQAVTKGLPVKPVGDTPGLSQPAATTQELVKEYQSAQVFMNTSLVSPIPTSLLESMACGCAVVSTANCMIPEIIQNGVNGFISNNPNELRQYAIMLLQDEPLRKKLSAAARQTILDRFSMDSFINNWNKIFDMAVKNG